MALTPKPTWNANGLTICLSGRACVRRAVTNHQPAEAKGVATRNVLIGPRQPLDRRRLPDQTDRNVAQAGLQSVQIK